MQDMHTRWAVAQREMTGLTDDGTPAWLTLVVDVTTGVVCGMGLEPDPSTSLSVAFATRSPGSESIASPTVLAVPPSLAAATRINLAGFPEPPDVVDVQLSDQPPIQDALTSLTAMLGGASAARPRGETVAELFAVVRRYLRRRPWQELAGGGLLLALERGGDEERHIAIVAGGRGSDPTVTLIAAADTDAREESEYVTDALILRVTKDVDDDTAGDARALGWPPSEARIPVLTMWQEGVAMPPDADSVVRMTAAMKALMHLATADDATVVGKAAGYSYRLTSPPRLMGEQDEDD